MRVAVTGASGFLGRAVLARLMAEGKDCVALSRTCRPASHCQGSPVRFYPDHEEPDERWAECLQDIDVLVHLAARAHQGEHADAATMAAFDSVNVGLTTRLARGASMAGVRHMVFMSSIKVCGERSPMDNAGQLVAFSRDCTPTPEGPYGLSKLRAEQILGEICRAAGMCLTVFRPPLIYGIGMRGNLLALMRAIRIGLPLPLASIRNRRSLVHRESVVEAISLALTRQRSGINTYTLADLDLSTPELVRLMARGMGKSPRLWPCPGGLLRGIGTLLGRASLVDRLTECLLVDSAHVRQELGWNAVLDPEQVWTGIGQSFLQGGGAWQSA